MSSSVGQFEVNEPQRVEAEEITGTTLSMITCQTSLIQKEGEKVTGADIMWTGHDVPNRHGHSEVKDSN